MEKSDKPISRVESDKSVRNCCYSERHLTVQVSEKECFDAQKVVL